MHCNLHIQTPSSERFERIDLHTKRSNTYEIEVLANLTQAFPNALHLLTAGVIAGFTSKTNHEIVLKYIGRWCNAHLR